MSALAGHLHFGDPAVTLERDGVSVNAGVHQRERRCEDDR